MDPIHYNDSAHFWRSPVVPGADMLTAQYYGQVFSPHWHEAYTISVIEDGAECYYYGRSRRIADTSSVPVINPGEVHTGARATDHGWRYRVFYLPVEFVQCVSDDIAEHVSSLPWFSYDVVHDLDLRRRFLNAHTLLQAGRDTLAADHALIDALSLLLMRYSSQRPTAAHVHRDSVRVNRMKSRLMANLMEPLTLNELAQSVQLSPFHAARLFAKEMGMAPHAWRNQMRLTRALEGLRAGMPATSIAADSGFADLSHFARHFKRAFGVSPGRWWC